MADGEDVTLDLNAPELPASGEDGRETRTHQDNTDLGDDIDLLDDDGQGDDVDGASEEEEIEHGGKKYRISKELKPLLMFQQDYTRKTQTVAEERKALEQEREALRQQVEADRTVSEDRKKLILVDATLDQYAKVDWQKFEQQDPLAAASKWREYQQLEKHRDALASKVESADAERSEQSKLERANRVQEAVQELHSIKGYGPEVHAKVTKTAESFGFSEKTLSKGMQEFGAPFVKVVHKAFLYDQLVQRQRTAARPTTEQTEPIKPLAPAAKGRSGSPRSGLSDEMSADDWVKARNRQLANRT